MYVQYCINCIKKRQNHFIELRFCMWQGPCPLGPENVPEWNFDDVDDENEDDCDDDDENNDDNYDDDENYDGDDNDTYF